MTFSIHLPVSKCLTLGAFTHTKPALFPLIRKKNNTCLITFFRIIFFSGILSWKDHSTNLYSVLLFILILHYNLVPNWAVLSKSKIWPIIIYLLKFPKTVLYLDILVIFIYSRYFKYFSKKGSHRVPSLVLPWSGLNLLPLEQWSQSPHGKMSHHSLFYSISPAHTNMSTTWATV